MANKKRSVFFEAGSWYHRVKILKEDGTTMYSKKGGFQTDTEAEKSYLKYEEEYKRAYRAFYAPKSADMTLESYLAYWLEQIYSARIENTTRRVAEHVLYGLIMPNVDPEIKLRYVNAQYLDGLLEVVSKTCDSAGNKGRELLFIAFKDAAEHGYIQRNLVPDTKPYKRKPPQIRILGKERMKFFLKMAAYDNWYLEILLGLFLGLRKGEILGLKYSDFSIENSKVTISRQLAPEPKTGAGQKASGYRMQEKPAKTQNSNRTLWVPGRVMDEVLLRKHKNDLRKQELGSAYIDNDYISCTKNGLPHGPTSFNTSLSKLCGRNGLPHLTVHSLRHMYATILAEKGVPLLKISSLLGHSSVHTTFEYYCEVMDEQNRILSFMNDVFAPEEI